MTYNDKDFEFKSNIKEIIAMNIRRYRFQRGLIHEKLAIYK